MNVRKPNEDLDLENLPEGVPFSRFLMALFVIIAAITAARLILPLWLPGLSSSVAGEAPKVFWYLSRGSAVVAYLILWASMVFGLLITNKMARLWPGAPAAFEIHEYTSLLGLGLALFHALILTGDQYIHYTVAQVLMPFSSVDYRPIEVGIGQVMFYVWAIVALSFYVRKRIGQKTWRWIHFASFASFLGVLVHGILSGTDSGASWANWMYWITGGSVLFLTINRIVRVKAGVKKPARAARPAAQRPARPEPVKVKGGIKKGSGE